MFSAAASGSPCTEAQASQQQHPRLWGSSDTVLQCGQNVLESLTSQGGRADVHTSVALNCCLSNVDKTLRGWYVTFPAGTPVSQVPLPSNLFDGLTVVETLASETLILDLLKKRTRVLQRMKVIAREVHSSNVANRATWQRCRPERDVPLQRKSAWKVLLRENDVSKYTMMSQDPMYNTVTVRLAPDTPLEFVPDESVPNYVDSAHWDPELSSDGFVGLYHQWYSSSGTGTSEGTAASAAAGGPNAKRQLKLYFVCQSQCHKAGLEVKHIINDVPSTLPISSLANCEEMWWLRNLNVRNRNRLIMHFANALSIPIPKIPDMHAFDARQEMAQPLTQSLLSNLYEFRDGRVGVACDCMPTQFVSNGIVCRMAPWEGVVIYSGVRTATPFGGAFGTEHAVFPLTNVALNPDTERLAHSRGHVIQWGSPSQHANTWAICSAVDVKDANTRSKQRGANADTCEDETVDVDEAVRRAALTDADFPGVSDSTLNHIALRAWKANKQQAAASLYQTQYGSTPDHMSFVSFDDDLITTKLKKLSWDPR